MPVQPIQLQLVRLFVDLCSTRPYLVPMIIRRIVLVWFAVAIIGTLITFYVYHDHYNRWLGVISAIAVALISLPVVFLITLVWHRFPKLYSRAMRFGRDVIRGVTESDSRR